MVMLRRKVFRDIKHNFSAFFTIFMMVFTGVSAFSGVHAYMDGMEYYSDIYYKEYHLQDLWLTADNFPQEDLEKVKAVEGVANAERALVVNTTAKGFKDLTFQTNFLETNEISRMMVLDGEGFAPEGDYVWIDSYCAAENGIQVGDVLTLSYEGYAMTLTVKGLIGTPDHLFFAKDESSLIPNYKSYGLSYVSMEQLPRKAILEAAKKKMAKEWNLERNGMTDLFVEVATLDFRGEDFRPFPCMYVELEDGADEKQVTEEIKDRVEVRAVTSRDACRSYASFQGEMEEGKTYSVIFTALFLCIAIISVVSTMGRFVKKQRAQIGTMKALGIKNRKIIAHYVSFGFYISAMAAVLGVVGGNIIIGRIFINMMKDFFQLPLLDTKINPIVYGVALSVVSVITFITYLSCRAILKEPASEAMRMEMPKIKEKERLREGGLVSRLKVGTRWNLRDIQRSKGRVAVGVLGVAGCMMLVVCAFGLKDSIRNFIAWQFEDLYRFESRLDLTENIPDKDLDDLLAQYGSATSMTVGVELEDAAGEVSTQSLLVDDADGFLAYTDHDGKETALDESGLFISEKLASICDYKVGDKVRFTIYGKEKVYQERIVGTFRTPQGQCVVMKRAYAEKIGIDYEPQCIYTNDSFPHNESIKNVETIQSKKELKKDMSGMLRMMNAMVFLLIIVSVILAIVIIYNVGVLSFAEKQYQFATMKVLGFRTKYLQKLFTEQNLWVSSAGAVLGLPLGYLITAIIYKFAIGDVFDIIVYISPLTYLCSAAGTFLFACAVNFLLARKMKSIDMVTSLKARE